MDYSFASVLSSGASFWASIMLPVIFSLPFMKAVCGCSLPSASSTMSPSAIVMVVSALPPWTAPSYTLAFFRSSTHSLATFPPEVILYRNTALMAFAFASFSATRSLIPAKTASLWRALPAVMFGLTTICLKST
uniref:Uncharacterized protein n=1 Tax=Anopheles darlingi TaxID=43151 RepID=A0A2M4DEF4_ANODA